MNIYILLAHPERQSMSGQMADLAVKTLTEAGHQVRLHDLFATGFKTNADRADFGFYDDEAFFDLQFAQMTAQQKQAFPADIAAEHAQLAWADLVIFQFPMWWQSMPAALKGYIDRVFSVGFAYNNGSFLAGKKAFVSCVMGAPPQFWQAGQRGDLVNEVFRHLFHGTLAFCGMKVVEPYFIGGTKRLSSEQRADLLTDFEKCLLSLDSRRVIM